MKTNFLPRSSRLRQRSRKREIIIIAAIFLFGAIGFSYFGKYLSSAISPLWRSNLLVRTGISNLFGTLRSKDALVAENTLLKERIASDEDLIVSLRSIASSRDELLSTFGRVEPGTIPASVLVHPPETPYDILLVDAGDDLHVKTGSLVSTPEGVLIGTISDVFSKNSRVKLYSTAGEHTDAVLERGEVSISLVGRGGGNLEFTIPRDTAVALGDRILSPYLDASLIGVVGDIEVTPTDSFKTVLAASPVNPANIRYVLIHK